MAWLTAPALGPDGVAGKKAAAVERFRNPRGRMDENGWGQTLYRYRSGPAEEATRAYAKLAKASGMSLTELSLRWAAQRKAVTTTLLGTSSIEQLNEDLAYFQKSEPLPRELLWEIDRTSDAAPRENARPRSHPPLGCRRPGFDPSVRAASLRGWSRVSHGRRGPLLSDLRLVDF
jgi:hypothetical protein